MAIFGFLGDVIEAGKTVVGAFSGGSDDISAGVMSGAVKPPSVAPQWTVSRVLTVMSQTSAAALQNFKQTVQTQFLSRNDVETPIPTDDNSIAVAASFLLNGGINGACGPQCTTLRASFATLEEIANARQFGTSTVQTTGPDGTAVPGSSQVQTTTRQGVVSAGGFFDSPVVLVGAGLAVALIASRR